MFSKATTPNRTVLRLDPGRFGANAGCAPVHLVDLQQCPEAVLVGYPTGCSPTPIAKFVPVGFRFYKSTAWTPGSCEIRTCFLADGFHDSGNLVQKGVPIRRWSHVWNRRSTLVDLLADY